MASFEDRCCVVVMCNRYESPTIRQTKIQWHLDKDVAWNGGGVHPRGPGLFIRGHDRTGLEPVVGRWGLIPHFAKTSDIRYNTNNARSEELHQKASYRTAWAQGQRCIIPAISFDEPCWETGKSVWWQFTRKDHRLWGLAGLWNTWTDHQTGEIVESYTMLTINADEHPLMSRMHKPDPKLPADQQDKRSVVVIEDCDTEQWLYGGQTEVTDLIRAPSIEVIHGGPIHLAAQARQLF